YRGRRFKDLFLSAHFFFPSRRRHTSWPRDWSSDVCSSDLYAEFRDAARLAQLPAHLSRHVPLEHQLPSPVTDAGARRRAAGHVRSEERRVGKECRAWWSPCD